MWKETQEKVAKEQKDQERVINRGDIYIYMSKYICVLKWYNKAHCFMQSCNEYILIFKVLKTFRNIIQNRGCISVVHCFPSMFKALEWIPITK